MITITADAHPKAQHMKRIVALIIPLCFLISLKANIPFDPSTLSREEAVNFVDMLVNMIDKDVAGEFKKRTGQTVHLSVVNNVMCYNFHLPEFTSEGMSPELARFFIAMNRPDVSQIEGIKVMASLLEQADYNIGYRYIGRDTLQAVMSPREFIRLITTPVDQLGFDYSEMLTQLIANFNACAQLPDIQREFSSYETGVDGAYITIRGVTRVPSPMLSDETLDTKVRQNLSHMVLKGPNSFSVKGLIKAARELRMKGIKYDLSDPEGNQRIITLSWDDMKRLANEGADPNDPEESLSMVDQFLTNDIAKMNVAVTFSHITEPTRLRFILTYDYPSAQFQSIVNNTGEDAMITTYGEFLRRLLPKMPEIQTITFEMTSTAGDSHIYTMQRSHFTND